METSGNQTNKAINISLFDPFLIIYRQLKDSGADINSYFRIIDKELRFYPIYKIVSIDPNLSQQQV